MPASEVHQEETSLLRAEQQGQESKSPMKPTNSPTANPSQAPSPKPVVRKLASDDNDDKPTILLSIGSLGPILPIQKTSDFVCSKETAGQTCPGEDASSGKFICCKHKGGYSCETCAECIGRGTLLNAVDELGKSCCWDSYLAEDTSESCQYHNNRKEYDNIQCCKTTPRRRADPEDFYCFISKGHAKANYAYCMALADNPPHIYGLETRKYIPSFLRGKEREINMQDMGEVITWMVLLSITFLLVFKKIVNCVLSSREESGHRDELTLVFANDD
jgi:hypothetical protein